MARAAAAEQIAPSFASLARGALSPALSAPHLALKPLVDSNRLIASLADRAASIELRTLDLCFLAALYVRAERTSAVAFSEEQLVDAFERVCEVVEPDGQGHRRASDGIRRLRDQRMLARVDGAGVVRSGEFALTRLATGILEFFLDPETLTRESLTLLTRTMAKNLGEVLLAAQSAEREGRDDGAWHREVVAPLHVTVRELALGIERRQRGFDLQQEHFQTEVAALLGADWFGAVERCQALLESTTITLRELNQVLLRDCHAIQGTLHELQELAARASADSAENAARLASDQMDRIAAWGSSRQQAFSEYYQYVHRYLRDVVRLDPSRVLSHRLREQLAGKGHRPYALRVAAEMGIRLLKEVEPPKAGGAPVKRRRPEAETPLAEPSSDDRTVRLEGDVRAALAEGARGLRDVTATILGASEPEERFVLAGKVAQIVGRIGLPDARADRVWRAVTGDLVLEDWALLDPR